MGLPPPVSVFHLVLTRSRLDLPSSTLAQPLVLPSPSSPLVPSSLDLLPSRRSSRTTAPTPTLTLPRTEERPCRSNGYPCPYGPREACQQPIHHQLSSWCPCCLQLSTSIVMVRNLNAHIVCTKSTYVKNI